ncbi:hypothetical protein BASA62_005089 [Batrachochytrium salamandrivorans]|nr:hypothetical protein BASA62_005089 [Batrachochytrium salamandrivorans]
MEFMSFFPSYHHFKEQILLGLRVGKHGLQQLHALVRVNRQFDPSSGSSRAVMDWNLARKVDAVWPSMATTSRTRSWSNLSKASSLGMILSPSPSDGRSSRLAAPLQQLSISSCWSARRCGDRQ